MPSATSDGRSSLRLLARCDCVDCHCEGNQVERSATKSHDPREKTRALVRPVARTTESPALPHVTPTWGPEIPTVHSMDERSTPAPPALPSEGPASNGASGRAPFPG